MCQCRCAGASADIIDAHVRILVMWVLTFLSNKYVFVDLIIAPWCMWPNALTRHDHTKAIMVGQESITSN